MVKVFGFDRDQDFIQCCLASIGAESCDGDCCFHTANEPSCDLPVWRVLQASSRYCSVGGSWIAYQLAWRSLGETNLVVVVCAIVQRGGGKTDSSMRMLQGRVRISRYAVALLLGAK